MNILIVSATPFEIAPLLDFLENNAVKKSFYEFEYNGHSIVPLITGIGMVNTALGLSRYKSIQTTDLLINAGIAGSFSKEFNLGTVVEVERDRFGDLGIEEIDGSFKDNFEMNWEEMNQYPYTNGWLVNDKSKLQLGLPKVSAITVNKVHGKSSSINDIYTKYSPHIESMEGASFILTCKLNDAKFHQIRAISNYVEPRNKENWNIDLAIDNLNTKLIKIIDSIA